MLSKLLFYFHFTITHYLVLAHLRISVKCAEVSGCDQMRESLKTFSMHCINCIRCGCRVFVLPCVFQVFILKSPLLSWAGRTLPVVGLSPVKRCKCITEFRPHKGPADPFAFWFDTWLIALSIEQCSVQKQLNMQAHSKVLRPLHFSTFTKAFHKL